MAPLMLCRLGLCSPSPKLERFRQTGTTMNVIDPRTAIVLISAMSALMALVLWALKRLNRARVDARRLRDGRQFLE